jgi:hypothetical protein
MDGWHILIKLNEWDRGFIWTLLLMFISSAANPRIFAAVSAFTIFIFLVTHWT